MFSSDVFDGMQFCLANTAQSKHVEVYETLGLDFHDPPQATSWMTVFAFAPPVGSLRDISTELWYTTTPCTHAFTLQVNSNPSTTNPGVQQMSTAVLNPSGDLQVWRGVIIPSFKLFIHPSSLFGLSPVAYSASPPLIRRLMVHCFSVYSPFNYPASATCTRIKSTFHLSRSNH